MSVVIEAGKLGRQIDSRGVIKDFTPDFFDEVVSSYDPSRFKAPAIISHDTQGIADDKLHTNKELSYGSAQSVKVEGDRLKIVFDKLSPKIKEHFDNGELLAVSPSFYHPDHSCNPTPGKWSLRHCAFLGATPPAIKGLNSPEFADGFDPLSDCLNFSWTGSFNQTGKTLEFKIDQRTVTDISNLFSSLRDWLIEKHGAEQSEKILPKFLIDEILMGDRSYQNEIDELSRSVAWLKEKVINNEMTARTTRAPGEISGDTDISRVRGNLAESVLTSSEDPAYGAYGQIIELKESMKTKKPARTSLKDTDEADNKEEAKMDDSSLQNYRDLAEELERERKARKLLEAQIQNEQRITQAERKNRKHDRLTNYCETLVKEGTLTAAQMGDRVLSFGEGEEAELSLVDFMMGLDPQQLSFMENFLDTQPKQIDYGEFAPDSKSTTNQYSFDFQAVDNAAVSEESLQEFEDILQYCEQNKLDPNQDEDFKQAAISVLK